MGKIKTLHAPVAVIDIGSATVHLLVVQPKKKSDLKTLYSAHAMSDLGLDVATNRFISRRRRSLVEKSVRGYLRVAKSFKAKSVLIAATGAFRDARNGVEVARALSKKVARPVHILSSETERKLSLLGGHQGHACRTDHLFIDCGGGSTEVTYCRAKTGSHANLDVGSVGLLESSSRSRIQPLDIVRTMGPIDQAIQSIKKNWKPKSALITGGVIHHVADLVGDAPRGVGEKQINKALRKLLRHSIKKISKRVGMERDRVASMVPGLLIIASLLHRFQLSHITVASEGLREGIARAYVRFGGAWHQNVNLLEGLRHARNQDPRS